DDIAPTLKAWRYAVENGSDYQMEHRVKMKSGIYKWHLSRAIPIHDSAGRIIKWYGTTTDIDDSKKAGDELANSKKKLDLALENANIGIWELNVSTSETFMDEKSEKMFGLEPGSFDRTLTGFEKLVHEEDLDHVRKSITDTLHHQLPFQTIFRTRPVHGTIRYISSRAMVTEDEKGKILTLTGVNFDITELKQGTENLISRLNMDLLRSNSDLQQFAYVASHDLQEPLRTISSFTQLLQKKYADKLDQDANEYINYAVNGSKRMYELINRLLSYSRIQTRASALSSASMESVLRKVKENLYLLITETKAEVTNDELPQVTVDENQMIQVLQNL
ncbi:PAS domain S-box protein, partial [bacterium]|nr:PAS domain S-box protein [bacterium]